MTDAFPLTPSDGRFNAVYHPARALSQSGDEVRVLVFTPWGKPRAKGFDLDVRSARFPRVPRMRFLESSYRVYRMIADRKIRRAIEEFTPDVVHAHGEWAAYSAVPTARRFGLPAVVTMHAGDMTSQIVALARSHDRLKNTLEAANRVLLVGSPLRAYLDMLHIAQENVIVLPNGWELLARRADTWPEELHVVTVAVLNSNKGVDLALRALASLHAPWRYDVVGDGPERKHLEVLTVELGVRDRVTFHGWLEHAEALNVLSTGNVFLLPSYYEAFGVAALEAMAMGLITIATQGRGPADFIVDGQTGYLVPPRDPTEIATVLQRIVDDQGGAKRMAVAGQDYVSTNLSWDRHVSRLRAEYLAVAT